MSTTNKPSIASEKCITGQTDRAFANSKIMAHHRSRKAVVYVRQSSPQQVIEHRESSALQYQLVEHAFRLGWDRSQIVVIDEDQGISAKSADARRGFQRLMADVANDQVGIVLGIEMSRLARSCKDWHQLLDVCAIFKTLLGDHDGLYDPTQYNDRLLLGLKGTMSEAELHILKNRMELGRLNKAKRGELVSHVPIGYIRLPSGDVALDPDEQVQSVVRIVFDKFSQLSSALAVLRYLSKQQIRLPVRPHKGPTRGILDWRRPNSTTVLGMLHNPIYAGAYAYGQRQVDHRKIASGKKYSGLSRQPQDNWHVLMQDRFPRYITWEQFSENQSRLSENASRFDRLGVPRDGATLLGGLIVCSRCGTRMTVSYRGAKQSGHYSCLRPQLSGEENRCQQIAAPTIDELVAKQVLQAINPASLELAIGAENCLRRQRDQEHQQWKLRLERAKYDVDRARRQYDCVEPENRLVARELERIWNQSLLALQKADDEYTQFKAIEPSKLSHEECELIRSLSIDLRALWDATTTKPSDRQIIIRELIERVEIDTENNTENVSVTLHWCGGFTSQHEVRRTVGSYRQLSDFKRFESRVRELKTEGRNATEIASIVNEEGFRTPREGRNHTSASIRKFLTQFGMCGNRAAKVVSNEVLEQHEWWLSDLANHVSISVPTLTKYCRRGWVHSRRAGNFKGWLILWADEDEIKRLRELRSSRRGMAPNVYPKHLTTPKPRKLP